jgi:hypothetical protein
MRFVRLDRGPGVDVNRVTPASRRVLGVAGLLVVIQLVLRTWVAARGNFWDDLILTGRSGSMPLLSTEFLLHDHDGHFMRPPSWSRDWSPKRRPCSGSVQSSPWRFCRLSRRCRCCACCAW